jgi:hypothetical protein
MKWLLIILGVVAVGGLAIVWRLMTYLPRARRDLSTIRQDDMSRLSSECEHIFAAKLQVALSSMTTDEAVAALDQQLRKRDIWVHFRDRKQPGWRYATVIGTYLGELVRRETGASWTFRPGEPPVLELQRGEASFMADPFERVLKHQMQGTDGDLSGWFSTLRVVARRIQKEGVASDTSA